jgi:hypothetical protein
VISSFTTCNDGTSLVITYQLSPSNDFIVTSNITPSAKNENNNGLFTTSQDNVHNVLLPPGTVLALRNVLTGRHIDVEVQAYIHRHIYIQGSSYVLVLYG